MERNNFSKGQNNKKKKKKKLNQTKKIGLNILLLPHNNDVMEKIKQANISKNNSRCENQLILLMLTGDKKYH